MKSLALLQSFTKTHETRFYDVYTKAVEERDYHAIDAPLEALENVLDIGHYYWCYISEQSKERTTEEVAAV